MTAGLTAIVLAAGRSRRMGRPKPLLPLGDRPVLHHVLAAVAAAEPNQTLLVLGPEGESIAASVVGLPLSIVWNRARESEMADSLRAALPFLPTDGQGVMVCLGDQPLIAPATCRLLAETHRQHPDRILQPAFKGRKGHPVLLPQALFREIDAYATLRDLLATHQGKLSRVEVDDSGIRLDMDTPEDYQRVLELWRRQSSGY